MILRYARHTSDLNKIERFYTEIVGLEKLGDFENHDTYSGIFLGYQDADWHLEFTKSDELPKNEFDEDDMLVFYVSSTIELSKIKDKLKNKRIKLEQPKNPYWSRNGIMISDPDNYKLVFSIKHLILSSKDVLSTLVQAKSIENWSELIDFVKHIPYGRNSNREDLALVLKENKGTCSSKHAFLKRIADLNGFTNVKLILGIYRMDDSNTPKIGDVISKSGLEYIPEAHCYLKLNKLYVDITNSNSNIDRLRNDILEEIEIEAEQVNNFKVEYHKNYLRKWIENEHIGMEFSKIWAIREACIKKLEEK